MFGIGEGNEAVPDVARGNHVELLAQAAGAAPIIRHGDDGGQIRGVVFQAVQEGGETGASSDDDDLGTLLEIALLKHQLDNIFHMPGGGDFQQ